MAGAGDGDRRRLRVDDHYPVLPRSDADREGGRGDHLGQRQEIRPGAGRGFQEGAIGHDQGARDLLRRARRHDQSRLFARSPQHRGRGEGQGQVQQMSKLFDKLKEADRMRAGAQRDRIEAERSAGQAAQAKLGEEKRGLDMARERQAPEAELRGIANAPAEAKREAEARTAAEAEAGRLAKERGDIGRAHLEHQQARRDAEKRAGQLADERRRLETDAAQLARSRADAEEQARVAAEERIAAERNAMTAVREREAQDSHAARRAQARADAEAAAREMANERQAAEMRALEEANSRLPVGKAATELAEERRGLELAAEQKVREREIGRASCRERV